MALTTMDVLQPAILKIGARRYRKTLGNSSSSLNVTDDDRLESYVEEDSYYYDDEPDCENTSSCKTDDGNYIETLKDIPSFYYKYIVGRGGEIKKSIETQTKTNIVLPKKGSEGNVDIIGRSLSGVKAARSKVQTIIEMHRREQPAYHFLAMSMQSTQTKSNLQKFKNDVLQMEVRGVDARIFQLPERLHLTICMMTFLNDEEIQQNISKIRETVHTLQQKYLGVGALNLQLQGIEYMNDDPAEVDVLYAKVHNVNHKDSRLQDFVNELSNQLASYQFTSKEYDAIKLHVTVMNTIFRSKHKTYKTKRETFDARPILKTFDNFTFGEVKVESLDLLLRGSFQQNNHYQRVGYVQL